jgi:DNA-binding PadR family transcriptional regulator
MTGYELKQRIDRSTTHFWHAELSQIYVTLKSLEAHGSVTSAMHEQVTRPDRRVYTITPAGKEEFQSWLSDPYRELSPKKETLILKIFFSGQANPEQVLTQLKLQLDLHQKQRAYYHEQVSTFVETYIKEYPELARDARMWEATRRFGEMYEEIYIKWIEEMIGVVNQTN